MSPYILRAIYLLMLSELLFTLGCSNGATRMHQKLRALAGPGAIDCGNSLLPTLVPKNNACAIGATVEHAPFYIRWEINDSAGRTTRGIAMNSVSQMFIVTEKLGTPDGELPVTPCDSPNLVPDKSVTSINTLMCAPRPPGVDQP
jgi:hypothetical protein